MPKAAHCSECGENVYVGPDGRCPKGHGPESLSDYYDAPDASAPSGGGSPEPPRKSKTGMIILIIVLVLLLCVIGVSVSACFAIQRGTNAVIDEVGEYAADAEADGDPLAAPTLDEEIVAEAGRMVEYFYPGFHYVEMAEATVMTDDAVDYHVVAESSDAPGFYITFFAQRNPNTEVVGADDPVTAYLDTEGGAVWLHPETVESGLAAFVGPNAMMPNASRAQIMTDFLAARDELVFVTEYGMASNVEIALRGITETDLEDWYDNFTTWTSTWDNDIQAGTWVERSFETEPAPGTP